MQDLWEWEIRVLVVDPVEGEEVLSIEMASDSDETGSESPKGGSDMIRPCIHFDSGKIKMVSGWRRVFHFQYRESQENRPDK